MEVNYTHHDLHLEEPGGPLGGTREYSLTLSRALLKTSRFASSTSLGSWVLKARIPRLVGAEGAHDAGFVLHLLIWNFNVGSTVGVMMTREDDE